MFAKLRPGHRRSGSTPTSPSPNQVPSGFLPIPPSSSHGPTSPSSIDDFLHGFKSPAGQAAPPQQQHSSATAAESPISPMPPNLPPIPRIASVYERPEGAQGLGLQHPELQRAKTTESFESQSSGSPILGDQHVFSPNWQEQQRVRDVRSPSAGSVEQQYRSPSGTLTSPPVKAGTSESEFRSILQGKHLPPIPGSGQGQQRRPSEIVSPLPSGASHHSDEAHQQYSSSASSVSRQPVMSLGNHSRQSLAPSTMTKASDRTTKTKTRLLNPMSLLLRRRNGQMLDHLSEESLVSHRNQNMISPGLPDDFDPSIRGKVVHDFSAPRPRRNFSNQNMTELGAERERRESSSQEGAQQYTKSRALSEDLRHEKQQQHTPVFKEHFEDDGGTAGKSADSALRAENLANSDFVARNSLLLNEEAAAASLPPFARVGQKTVYRPVEQPPSHSPPPPPVPAKDQMEVPTRMQQPMLSPLLEDPVSPDVDATPKRQSKTSTLRQQPTTPSKRSPASARSSRISRMNSAASQQNGLPSHMFSRASRFSFQYSSGDSAAQEQLLEERHREKAAKAKKERGSVGYEDEEDEFDYDDLDLDNMEDDVPMNGEAWDYGGGFGGGLGIGNMTLDDMGSRGGLGGTSMDDFGDEDEFGGGGGGLGDMSLDDFGGGGLGGMTLDGMPGSTGGGLSNMTLDDISSKAPAYNPLHDNPAEATAGAAVDGLGLGLDTPSPNARQASKTHSHASSVSIKRKPVGTVEKPPSTEQPQDDFYFADGDFADEDFLREINGEDPSSSYEAFDESVFDDPNHPLYERKQPTHAPPIPRMSSKRTHNTLKGRRPRSRPTSEKTVPLPEHPDPGAPMDQVEAYQSALAMFAHKAAEAGRFERKASVSSEAGGGFALHQGGPVQSDLGTLNEVSPPINAQPELTPDVARLSQESSTLSPATARVSSGGGELDTLGKSVGFMLPGAGGGGGVYDDSYASDFDYSDYDSTFEDDPMIAAANAEALENDDEGLYGSEFGFYARPGEPSEDAAMYGGYFGPKNWGEIKRQRSTREPNLTPITERSEYSTRNSFIGVGFAEHERDAKSSPALAQLARMSPGWGGEDMSLENLLKLRSRAWGGSQGSLPGLADKSSPRPMSSSSPMAGTSPVLPKAGEGMIRGVAPMWTSSPMSRSVFSPGEGRIPEDTDAADDEFDEGMRREANFDEEDDEGEEGLQEYEYDGEGDEYPAEADVSPLDDDEDESPLSESPTIRANALPETHSPSVSPMKLGPPFSFPTTQDASPTQHPTLPAQVSPISTTSPATSNTMTTLPTTHSARSSAVLVSPVSPAIGSAGGLGGGGGSGKTGHSRSGSDSVSYSRERDEEGGMFRWVLERRRTAEDGGEVVERRAVEGGRI